MHFIYSFNRYLLGSVALPSTIPGIEDPEWVIKFLPSMLTSEGGRETENKQTDHNEIITNSDSRYEDNKTR